MKPLLALSMIVRDEAATLPATLASVGGAADVWWIADTGSADRTPVVAKQALSKARVAGGVCNVRFDNFAQARNEALSYAEDAAEFVLWLDADDELVGGDELRRFLEARERGAEPGFMIRVDTGVWFDSARILRSSANWAFVGEVHEAPVPFGGGELAGDLERVPGVVIRRRPGAASVERSRARWERDVEVLRRRLAADPNDARAAFYLAQTLRWLGRWDEAVAAYDARIRLFGWAEEIFHAWMGRAACLAAKGAPWADVLETYFVAVTAAPHRAEPLYELARCYAAGRQWALARVFARAAAELELPEGDALFVDYEVYEFKARALAAEAAAHLRGASDAEAEDAGRRWEAAAKHR